MDLFNSAPDVVGFRASASSPMFALCLSSMPSFSDSAIGARFESIARVVAAVVVVFYVAGELFGRAIHALNDWLACAAPAPAPTAAPAPAPAPTAAPAPAVHPLALIAADRFESVTVRQLRRYVRRSAGMRRAELIGALCAVGC
jgi:hypothetical protein